VSSQSSEARSKNKTNTNRPALEKIGLPHFDGIEGLAAVFIAHLSHLLSVLVLFQLTLALFPRHSRIFAFVSASLHIISPAGLFLSAPYAESSCALLSFAGTLAFYKSFAARGSLKHFLILLSGLSFGIATTFRSNGILSGFLLLEQAVRLLMGLLKGLETRNILSLISTGVAGMLVGAGFVLPQYIAYTEYCRADTLARPWCQRTLPSVYVFVQDHYWYAPFSVPSRICYSNNA
jgi:phosphatidylinositol glycan class V